MTDIFATKEVVRLVGLEAAVLYQHIAFRVRFSILHGERRDRDDKRHYVRLSMTGLCREHDYFNLQKVKRLIAKLKDAGLILSKGVERQVNSFALADENWAMMTCFGDPDNPDLVTHGNRFKSEPDEIAPGSKVNQNWSKNEPETPRSGSDLNHTNYLEKKRREEEEKNVSTDAETLFWPGVPVLDPDEYEDRMLAEQWFGKTKEISPSIRANIDEWTKAIGKARKILQDNNLFSVTVLYRIIQDSHFWKGNILSPCGLFKKGPDKTTKLDKVIAMTKTDKRVKEKLFFGGYDHDPVDLNGDYTDVEPF